MDAQKHRALHDVWIFCKRVLIHADPRRSGRRSPPQHHLNVSLAFTADLHIHTTPYAVSTEQLYHTKGCTAI